MKRARALLSGWPVLWLALWFSAALLCSGASSAHRLERALLGASWAHPFGFDAFGRDLLTTSLKASLLSAGFAFGATVTACLLGALIGALIAVAPPRLRGFSLRILDAVMAFPYLIFALAWAALQGPGWGSLTFALLIGSLPSMVRLAYLRGIEILRQDYVLASVSLGAGAARIMRRSLLPGVFPICSVKAPNLFAGLLMAEATLSFLGVGAPIGRDTWGSLLLQGNAYLLEAPHVAMGSGIPLAITILSLQLFAENLSRHRLS